jgi:hypothetical protein
MSQPTKSFLFGFVVATALFVGGAFVLSNLRDAAIASKSKRLLSQTSYIDEAIQHFRRKVGRYPASKRELVESLKVKDQDFDYFLQDDHYTLIYPSLTGRLQWEPYVVQDGRLAAYPVYMEPHMKNMGLQRGSALAQRPNITPPN